MDWLKKFQISATARQEFYELMGNFISDGIPFFDALQNVDKQFVIANDPRKWLTTTAIRRMRGGEKQMAFSFGHALQGMVPPIEAMTIDAGEQSGDMTGALMRAATIAKNASRIKKVIWGELAYPVFLVILMCALLIMLSTVVMPVFEQIASRERWPTAARLLGGLADHAVLVIILSLLLVGGWIGAFIATKDRWVGETRDKFDRFIFPWNMHRRIASALIMSSIAALMRMGVPISTALDKLGETSGAWARNHFGRVKNKMRKGAREGDALAGDLFDKGIRWQIILYGQLTDFSGGLERLSERLTEAIIEKTKSVFGLIRTLAMVAVAIMIVWVYGSFMLVTMAARSAV